MKRKATGVPAFFLSVLFFVSSVVCFSFPVSAKRAVPDLTAGAAFLYCTEQSETVYSKNADQTVYPASTVKIMTGLLACELLSDRLDEKVTIEKKMLGKGSGYRCLKLKENDVLTVRDLLYGAVCGNDYDACYVLAYLVCGSTEAFLSLMNERAQLLGATNTHYTNPTGVHDPAMTTTASDTAKIALAAANDPLYLEISSVDKYTTADGVRITNRNSLICASPYRDSRCKGLNTGMTDEGGYCLATIAGNGSYTYLCVLMNVPKENVQYTEALSLLDWVFSAYGDVELIAEGVKVGSVSVRLSDETKSVDLYTKESVGGYFPTDILSSADFVTRCTLPNSVIDAPITAGQTLGSLTLMYQGKVIATVPVVAKDDVQKSGFLSAMESMRSLTAKRWIRISLIAAVVLLVLYALLVFLYQRNKRLHRAFRSDAYASMTRDVGKHRQKSNGTKNPIRPPNRDRNGSVPPPQSSGKKAVPAKSSERSRGKTANRPTNLPVRNRTPERPSDPKNRQTQNSRNGGTYRK